MTHSNRNWFLFNSTSLAPEILIYDEIGAFGVTAKDFDTELKNLGSVDAFNLRINSPGGSVFDAVAIYNMLVNNPARITVYIDGIAASAASMIAMAGHRIIMPANAMMMIHDPAALAEGGSRAMAKTAELLETVKAILVTAYVKKSGQSHSSVESMMSEETWMTAEEALALGFADEVEEPVEIAASFDLSKFKSPPAQTMAELSARYWTGKGKSVADMKAKSHVENGPGEITSPSGGTTSLAPDLVTNVLDENAIWQRYRAGGSNK